MFNMLSFLLRYIFITVIYLFIFGIIRMIYLDISRMDVPSNSTTVLPTKHPYLLVRNKRDELYYDTNSFYPLSKDEMIIGRNKNCDICFEDIAVSSKHLLIWKDEGEWRVKDIGSRNGSEINGEEMNTVFLLDDGDIIQIGDIELQFVLNK